MRPDGRLYITTPNYASLYWLIPILKGNTFHDPLDEKAGLYKFIEINGRPWGWHTLAKAAGANIPYAMFCHLTDRELPVVELHDAKWMRILTDAPTALREIARGNLPLTTYLGQLFGRKECAVLSWKDPLPFFAEIALLPYLIWNRVF